MSREPPLRLLFLQADALAAEIRIRPLLDVLRSQNQIRGYAVVDRNMLISGDVDQAYDAVLVHRNPSMRQLAWLRSTSPRFAYDIDDLLLGSPAAELSARGAAEQAAIAWCLTNAHRVLAPSRCLIASLESRLGTALGERSFLLFNPGAELPPPPKTAARPRLLWVSSTLVPVRDEITAACEGIAAAARVLKTDIVLVGPFAAPVLAQFGRREHIAWLPPAQYREFLAQGSLIAMVPLPIALPPDEQAFVHCKSDLKAAQYGSNRIAGIYSPIPPYTESDLPCFIAPANTAEGWRQSILACAEGFPMSGNALTEHPAISARRPSILAKQLLTVVADVYNTRPI